MPQFACINRFLHEGNQRMSYILIRVTNQFHEGDDNGDAEDEKSASTKTTSQGSSAKTLPTFYDNVYRASAPKNW